MASLSEGRGTSRPFELIGGPGLDYHRGDRVAAHDLPGTAIREAYFVPVVHKFADQLGAGLEIKINDRKAFDPIRTAVALLVEARKYPEFAWRDDGGDRPYFRRQAQWLVPAPHHDRRRRPGGRGDRCVAARAGRIRGAPASLPAAIAPESGRRRTRPGPGLVIIDAERAHPVRDVPSRHSSVTTSTG